jgi:membrane protein YdbS with pleckstrin-like domain
MTRIIKNSHPGERVLFKTRPLLLSALESTFIRFILLLLLLYFFSTIITYFALIQGSVSSLVNIPFVEWATDILILLIAILFFWILWSFLSWRSVCYILTNQRVMIKSGVISKKSVYMHYDKMQDIIVTRGLLQRLSSSGNIEIFGGHDRTSLIMENIPKPDEVEDMINQKIEGDEEEYGSRDRISQRSDLNMEY